MAQSVNTQNGDEGITVCVVDDHDIVRKGLRYYLSAHSEVQIVGEATLHPRIARRLMAEVRAPRQERDPAAIYAWREGIVEE